MKPIPLVISLFFIVCIAGINVALLYDNYSDYGISKFFSLAISTIACIPVIVLLCFRSEIKWVLITKVLAIVTMATPAFVEEYRRYDSMSLREVYCTLNALMVLMGIVGMVLIQRKSGARSVDKSTTKEQ